METDECYWSQLGHIPVGDIWWHLSLDKHKMPDRTGTTNCQRDLNDFPIAAFGRSDPQLMQGGSPSNGAAAGTFGPLNGLNCGTVDVTAVSINFLTAVL
jgi:hypothetical protein